MRTFPRYSLTFLAFFVIFIILWEEFHVGTGYIYWQNQYDHEVFREISVNRTDKSISIGIVIVVESVSDEEKYEMALDTVKCYSRHFGYNFHVIHVKDEPEIRLKCQQKDFMFRRHCALSHKMPSISSSWLLFLDADMGIINPNHLIEEFLPNDPKVEIVFYNRIMNHEVMAGSYLVRNSKWSQDFLLFWAEYEQKLPKSFHGSDNGAIHSVIMEYGLPKLEEERKLCEDEFWRKSNDYEGLSTYEVCAQLILDNNKVPEIQILKKGRFAWARDGWLTKSVWSSRDFIFHGWQKKRKDKLIFAMWHSPLVYEHPFDIQKCAGPKAFRNWRYKNTFMGGVIDVDRQILSTIEEQHKSFEKHSKIVEKIRKSKKKH